MPEGEYVRLTAQGIKEAENLMNINAGLRRDGYMVPLVADIHFNPKVADVAAQYVEKVRINPGNYVDAARTFKHLEYTDEEYAQKSLQKIHDRFVPFPEYLQGELYSYPHRCKSWSHCPTALCLATAIHGRYGGIMHGVPAHLCKEDFTDVVISIKASIQ